MVEISEQAVQAAISGYASSKQHTFDGQIHDALTAAAPHMSALEREQALEEGYRRGVDDAAKKAAELLVFTDTTSKAIKEIIAAISALKSQPAPQTGGGE